jgi:hypothetical protein
MIGLCGPSGQRVIRLSDLLSASYRADLGCHVVYIGADHARRALHDLSDDLPDQRMGTQQGGSYAITLHEQPHRLVVPVQLGVCARKIHVEPHGRPAAGRPHGRVADR